MPTGTITSLGIGSSLDLQGILDSLRDVDEATINRQKEDVAELEATRDEFNVINAKLLGMKSSALSLSLSSNFLDRTSSVSDSNILSATTANGTDIGAYSMTVNRLTSSSSLQSTGKSSSTNSINVPTIQKSVDTFSSGETFLAEDEDMTITYGYGDNKKVITVTGESGGNTISEVAALINQDTENGASNIYVTASALAVSDTEFVLRIKATNGGTGETNRVMVTIPPAASSFAADLDRDISVSSSAVLSASIIHGPSVGSYTMDVDRLATQSSFQSDEQTDENALVSSGADTFEYTVGSSSVFSVAVTAATTLADLRDAINTESPDEVTASIVDSGTGKALLIEADSTGEDSRIVIVNQVDQVTMTESNGADFTMTGDSAVAASTTITEGSNDSIVFKENNGSGYSSEITATIAAGTYTQTELASAVESALETASAASGNSKNYLVSYNSNTGYLEIEEAGTLTNLQILWSSSGTTAEADLGFDATDETISPKASSLNYYVEVDGTENQDTDNTGITDLITGTTIDLTAVGTTTVDITQGDAATFSYIMGDSDEVSLSITSDMSMAELVTLINDDTNNPGVTASIIDTGSGETPYRLMLKANTAGEDARITITSDLADLAMTEANGSGYTMASDNKLSFTSLTITEGDNDDIDFMEDAGSGLSAELTATIAAGTYRDMDTLAAAIESAMETASTNSVDYAVTYNSTTGRFNIEDNGATLTELQLLWQSGSNTATSAASHLGYDTSADDAGAINYTSDSTIQLATTPLVIRASDTNTDIVFQEDTGSGYGSSITATIADGVYSTGSALAEAVETALETASSANGNGMDYIVSFNSTTSKLEIQEAGSLTNLKILWSDGGSTAASDLGFDATDQTITPGSSSLNASVEIDGIEYQRSKNTGLTDLITGVTLSLVGVGTASFNVTEDTSAIKENITSIITTFNDLITEIDANDDYDEDTDTWGTLAKHSSIRSAKDTLLNLLGTEITINSSIKTYYDLGFEVAKDGSVTLDESILDNMLTSYYSEIKTFFTGSTAGTGVTGVGDLLNDQLREYTTTDGLIDSETDTIENRISRLEEDIEESSERLDKRYETMAQQFVRLDSYMRQIESQQNYVNQIFSATNQEEGN